MTTTKPPVLTDEEIDALRIKAFQTSAADDRQAYFEAASRYFQDRHYRALDREQAVLERAGADAVRDAGPIRRYYPGTDYMQLVEAGEWVTYDDHVAAIRALKGTPAAASANEHIDDDAVDAFAVAMKDKLADARRKGRSRWFECDPADLSRMLRDHVEKGDPRDVANFCMFLWSLGKPITPAAAVVDALPVIPGTPPRIWLVLGDDGDEPANFDELGEVTWCAHPQGPGDIEYVLAAPQAGQPSAAVADDPEFVTQTTVRNWTAEDWCELFERAPTVAALVRSQLVPIAAPQLSGNAGEVGRDPLQGAADWLMEALGDCSVRDIAQRLSIGINRAQRIKDEAAIAASKGANHG